MIIMGMRILNSEIFHPKKAINPNERMMLIRTIRKGINTPFHSLNEKYSIKTIRNMAMGSSTTKSFMIFPEIECLIKGKPPKSVSSSPGLAAITFLISSIIKSGVLVFFIRTSETRLKS
jgi:hypothetical protein